MQEKSLPFKLVKNIKIKKCKKINKIFYNLFDWSDIIKGSLVLLYKKNMINNDFTNIYNFDYFTTQDIRNLNKYNIDIVEYTKTCWSEKICQLCKNWIKICRGHLGCFKLEIPIYNNFYKFNFFKVLDCICFNCYLYKFNKEIRKNLLGKNLNSVLQLRYNVYHKYFSIDCFNRLCYSCFKMEKIITSFLEKHRYFVENQTIYIKNSSLDTKFKFQKIISKEYLAIHFIKTFENLKKNEEKLFGIGFKLKNFIFYFFPISSIFTRINLNTENLYIENKVNIYYKKIIFLNHKIHLLKKKKDYSIINVLSHILKIQFFCELLIYESNDNQTKFNANKIVKNGILNRLSGKKGRMRNTVLSKRVDFSARAVISPNSTTLINNLSIAFFSSKKLSFPLKIIKHNFRSIINKHSNIKKKFSIKYLVNVSIKKKISIRYVQNKFIKKQLKDHFIMEREILENDIVLFNRQPSLHRFSMLSLQLKIQSSKTFSFNPIICVPFNADFDGDEMNIHLLQDTESKLEALNIMSPFANFNLTNNFRLLFASIQDQIYICYLKINKKNLTNVSILKSFSINSNKINYTFTHFKRFFYLKYCISNMKKNFLFSSLKDDIHNNFFANKLDILNNNENNKVFHNYYLTGVLSKHHFINKNIGLAELIAKLEGKFNYQTLMTKINYEASKRAPFFSNTIGVDNIIYQKKIIKNIHESNSKNEIFFKNVMHFYNKKITLRFKSICVSLRKNEYLIIKQLVNFYQKFYKLLFNLSFTNSIYLDNLRLINNAGSKGTKANILSIKLYLGFQSLIFKMYPSNFMDVTFSFYVYNSQSLNYNNIVSDSFTKGLDKTNFFTHVSAGREAVVESSIKASETGYLARKLQVSMCDIFFHYDFSIRSNMGTYLNSIVHNKLNKIYFGLLNLENYFYYNFLSKKYVDYQKNIYKIINPYKYFNQITLTLDIYPYFNLNLKYWKVYEGFFISTFNFLQFNFCLVALYDYLCIENAFKKTKICYQVSYLTKFVNDYYFYSIFKLFIFEKVKNLGAPGTPIGLQAVQSLTEPCTQMTLKTFHFTGSVINNIHKAFIKIRNILNTTISLRNNSYFIIINSNKIYLLGQKFLRFKQSLKKLKNQKHITDLDLYYNNKTIQIKITISNIFKPIRTMNLLIIFIVKLKKIIKKNLKLDLLLNRLKITTNIKHTIMIYRNFLHIVSKCEAKCYSHKVKMYLKKKHMNFIKRFKVLIKLEFESRFEPTLYTLIYRNSKSIVSNNVYYIFKNFGVEASRLFIYELLLKITNKQKIKTKKVYIELISDYLTYNAKLNGVILTKQIRNKNSTLHLMSLEKPLYVLKKSTFTGGVDNIKGFIENIFSGNQVLSGTGLFKVIS